MENFLNFMWPFGSMNSNVSMGGIDQTNAANNMKANTNYPAITGLPHSGFEEMDFSETVTEPQKKGSNSFGIPSMFLNALNFRNPLSERSSNYNPALAGQIEDLNKVNFLGTQSSPYQIAGGPLAGKNLVSMFGTNDYDQMLADKAGWFQKRKDEDKGFSQKNWDAIIAEIAARDAEKKIKTDTAAAARSQPTGQRDTSGWSSPGYTTRGGFTGTRGSQHGGAGTGQRGHHGNFSQGGRVGYNRGDRVGILAAF